MAYTITLARQADLALLPDIETRATALFDGYAVTADLPLVNSDLAEFEHSFRAGLLWVARDGSGAPVGFALCESLGPDIHLEELDVDPAHGRRGIGKDLVMEVCRYAAGLGRDVTLTTFRDIPWNQPFYERLGFRVLGGEGITQELAERVVEETAAGLPPQSRVVMRRPRL